MAWLFVGFVGLIALLLLLDLGVFHRDAHEVSLREATGWTAVWIVLGLSFSVFVYFTYELHWFGAQLAARPGQLVTGGHQAALQYITAYLIEKSLSVDNVFVIAVIFTSFGVEPRHQHRVLFWGIFGALVTRAIMIGGGLWLLSLFDWVLYIFGAYLAFTGIKLLRAGSEDQDTESGRAVGFLKRLLRVAPADHNGRFIISYEGQRRFTLLALVLFIVEWTDVVFAVDSIPAVLAVSSEPFIVFTSNVFAILGLRSLYFVLAHAMGRFEKLKIGLAAVMIFVGGKMLMHDLVHVPNLISLAVVVAVIGSSIVWSLWRTRRPPERG
jgi:tellurite resistance protein TerC